MIVEICPSYINGSIYIIFSLVTFVIDSSKQNLVSRCAIRGSWKIIFSFLLEYINAKQYPIISGNISPSSPITVFHIIIHIILCLLNLIYLINNIILYYNIFDIFDFIQNNY